MAGSTVFPSRSTTPPWASDVRCKPIMSEAAVPASSRLDNASKNARFEAVGQVLTDVSRLTAWLHEAGWMMSVGMVNGTPVRKVR